jgi:membrane protease YdiL (CAAX protease family)
MEETQEAIVFDATAAPRALVLQKRQYNTIIIAGIAIALLFDAVVSNLVITKNMDLLWRVFFSRIIIWGTLPLLYQYAHNVEDRPFLLWKEKKQNIYVYIAAIGVLFAFSTIALSISSIPRRLGFHDNYTVLKHWDILLKQNKPMLVFVCLTAGVTEELLIRGYVYPRLCLLFKSGYIPVIVSALMFSYWHLGYENLGECIFTFLFGLTSALCYQKYRNIKILMIFHFLYDLMVSI